MTPPTYTVRIKGLRRAQKRAEKVAKAIKRYNKALSKIRTVQVDRG